MDFSKYIVPELLVTVPVLYFIGYAIKSSEVINSKHIPLTLAALGIVLALVWVLSQPISSLFTAAFSAVVQGILCAGAAVFVHQTIKQSMTK